LGAAAVFWMGCAAEPGAGSDGDEHVAEVGQGVTCITIQNQGPITTSVDDAQLVTDVADPTKANTNFGAVAQMVSGYSGTAYQRLLFKFNVPGAGIPIGSVISSASLKIRLVQSPGKANVNVHAATALWNESTVTWNSYAGSPGGGLGNLQATIVTNGVTNNSTLSVDLPASLVQTWLTAATNYGVVLDHPASGRTVFASSEAPTLAPRPKLDVCYALPSCSDGVQNQGELGIDCSGPCSNECAHPPATEVVSAGGTGTSAHYKATFTIGQPSIGQGTGTSANYRSQDGLIGANGSLP
jgi:hypothetical protein